MIQRDAVVDFSAIIQSRSALVWIGITCATLCWNARADDAGLQEVVVTAQKREQNLIDVPVAVTALQG